MTKRTTEERIQELQAKIEAIKNRDERKQARSKPETRFLLAALHAIDKGLNATQDAVLRTALDEARATVSSCLGLLGVTPKVSKTGALKVRRKVASTSNTAIDADAVLRYIRNNAGQKGEVIAAEFETDTATLRTVLKELAAQGAIKSQGKGRGTTYMPAGKRAAAVAG